MADRPELVEAKSFWDDLFARNRREGPALDCPVSLTIDLTWPWNTSDTKKDRMNGLVWHSAKPDLENTAKTIIDAMVRQGYFVNDSRVVSLTLRKYRGDTPSVAITIEKECEV